jgi:amidohydrolase
MDDKKFLSQLAGFRRDLHQHPEVSGDESETAKKVKAFVSQYNPDRIKEKIGGNGLIAEFKGVAGGPTVMFRCELDGLPIEEKNEISHKSTFAGRGHLCGHDGHMAMVAGLAHYLNKNRPKKGRVLLLFQPAEETGHGANDMIRDKLFNEFQPDYIFAIHNLPGVPLRKVVLSNNHFAAASQGMKIALKGKSSHAAEPELGISPGVAMAKILLFTHELASKKNTFSDFVLITPVHAKLGNLAYGTSPGEAVVHLTLRSYRNEDMTLLTTLMTKKVNELAKGENLKAEITFEEIFPATVNTKSCTQFVYDACKKSGLSVGYLEHPFRWSEDFGHFTSRFPGALFGLGSGTNQPALHNPDYDFPDELIPTGIDLYKNIYTQILGNL